MGPPLTLSAQAQLERSGSCNEPRIHEKKERSGKPPFLVKDAPGTDESVMSSGAQVSQSGDHHSYQRAVMPPKLWF
ncbi:uncharacterized protein MEPE_03244 [Melanopsichium pennsylvanicum]|uniref:Uncharacterized protein n=1 Tax=Melanopsichium pennsylvanicum TaxID=63383 RepID=A0AAJ4XLS4_9BASI|nr:uncharacterized protein MEPE_03244 [Melanopsichium pennsylvanicum]